MKDMKAQKVRARRRVMHHRMSILGITGVVIVLGITLAVGSISMQKKNREYKRQEAELEAQLEDEKTRAEELEELEEYVGTNEYVEDVAKDKLGLVYPNETLFEAVP